MKRLLIPLLLGIILAGCGVARPTSDWCFRFDFTQSNYGVNLIAGSWISGRGFMPPSFAGLIGGGHVELAYIHTGSVTPKAAILYLQRPADALSAPITAEGEATIFGMESGWLHTTIPPDVDSAVLTLRPGQGSGTSSAFSMVATVSRAVELRALEVLGDGANPFPQNNCGDFGTPTPSQLIPTVEVPGEDINSGLAQAQSDFESVDSPLSPGMLPNPNVSFLFGVIKWFLNPTSADELFGVFAPVYWHFGVAMQAAAALGFVYVVIYIIAYIIRWIQWILRTVLLIVQLITALPIVLAVLAIGAAITIIAVIVSDVARVIGGS